jgi:CheY-like chemotaxis protein
VEVHINKLGVGGREWLEVKVTDGGSTVVEDYTSFFDASTQKKRREVGGRGLGLFCLERRVIVLQGACGAGPRKEEALGSTVWFRIPFHDNTRQVTRPVTLHDSATLARRSNSRPRERRVAQFVASSVPVILKDPRPLHTVLVVDDSISILKMTKKVLELEGCQVDKAKNGLVALDKMKARIYDLVIMDVQMPVMTGLEAARRLRAWEMQESINGRKRQLIVGVSANSEGIMKTLCEEAGMDYFSIKPFLLEDMLAIYRKSQI